MLEEETKYNLEDTKQLLNPFTHVNFVMEKVFVTTKNNDISIKELWDQINKIKESIGTNKTKDGIYISSESIPHLHVAGSRKDPKTHRSRHSKTGSDINNLSVSMDLKEKHNSTVTKDPSQDISEDHINSILLMDDQDDKNQRFVDLFNKQAKKLNKLEKKLKEYKNYSYDKIESLEGDINTLAKVRMDDMENILKNFQADFEQFQESQKNKDYNLRTHLKDATYDLEVSIKSLKRNMLNLQLNAPEEDNQIESENETPEDQKEEHPESARSARSNRSVSKNESNKEVESPKFSQKSSPKKKKVNQNSNAIVMLWDEIDKLQSKFDNFVNIADFDELAEDVDYLKDKLAQIRATGNPNIEQKEEDNEFSESDPNTPANFPSAKEDLQNIQESPDTKEEQKSVDIPRKNFQDKHIKDIITEEHSDLLSQGEGIQTPGVLRSKNSLAPRDKIQKFSTSIKEDTPSRFSTNRRGQRGARRGGTSKTLQEVRKVIEKWPEVLEALEELTNSGKLNYKNIYQVRENLSELKDEIKDNMKKRIDSIYNTITEETKKVEDNVEKRLANFKDKNTEEVIKTLQLQVEKLNVQFDSTYTQVKANEGRIKSLDEYVHSPFGNLLQGDDNHGEDSSITELRNTIEDMKRTLNKTRTEVYKSVKDCENKLLKKADEDLVADLEEAFHQGIDQVMASSAKKFADRRDTNKSIRLLEQNMKNMYDLFISKDDQPLDAEDAMIASKNLGFTCMSCEKNILNLEGKVAEFNNWGKLPYRDPSERMMRVGHGFSKMLNSIKTNISKNAEVLNRNTEGGSKNPDGKDQTSKSRRNLSLEPNVRTDVDIGKNSSISLLEITKTEDKDVYLTMKPKKINLSVIKKSASKKDRSKKDAMRKSMTVMNKNKSQGGLPKIESSKIL